jgi:hypothetical protein
MYYILNETNQVIAADDSLLNLCEVAHINELFSSIARENTIFDFVSDESLSITTKTHQGIYTVSKTPLLSLVGNLTLITLTQKEVLSSELPDTNENSSEIIDSIVHEESQKNEKTEPIDENIITFKETVPTEFSESENTTFNDSELFDLVLDDEDSEEKNEIVETKEATSPLQESSEQSDFNDDVQSNETKDLDIKLNLEEIDEADDQEVLEEVEKTDDSDKADILEKEDDSEKIDLENVEEIDDIKIDINKVSQEIGISPDDYNNFLNDFIDNALELEENLQNDDDKIRLSAIETLSQLSDILQLSVVGNIITKLSNTSSGERRETIELFYATLSRITTSVPQEDKQLEFDKTTTEEKLELFDEPTISYEPSEKEDKERKTSKNESFGSFSLGGIKPKHFDFQLEEAANDLSLPVELIEEFVHDFIDQAHIETKKMLEAYEEGDLDTIQKIGHLLKGASSNLRINPLSETLYKIQFCEDPSQLEALIKDYWAHFLSFDNQINAASH